MKIPFTKSEEAFTPQYATEGSSGVDFHSMSDYYIPSGRRLLIATGLAFAMPPGVELQIRSRSGLSSKKGLIVLNAPATIDNDYRGQVFILLYNAGFDPVEIKRGDRVAQGVFAPVIKVELDLVSVLDETERGSGGLGSTGQ